MRSVQVSKSNGPLEIVERDIPEPGATQVRIKVRACGICHSDSFTKEGLFPGIQYPRVPGHEIAGVIDKVGKDVTQWEPALVVNGIYDEMIPVRNSYWLGDNLPNAVLLTYPDSGHGSLFQFHESFTRHAAAFLNSGSHSAAY
jgi:NADPH:quinone reductase-like Zn-dependent oxidoreductase